MSRRTQCRAFLLALAFSSAHAASPALHAAPASGRPASSVDRLLQSPNPFLPLLARAFERLIQAATHDQTSFDKVTGSTPPPPPPPQQDGGPAIDPNGGPTQ